MLEKLVEKTINLRIAARKQANMGSFIFVYLVYFVVSIPYRGKGTSMRVMAQMLLAVALSTGGAVAKVQIRMTLIGRPALRTNV